MRRFALDVHPPSGPKHRPEEDDEHRGEERREQARKHRRHVLDDALLRLNQPGRDQNGPDHAAWQQPGFEEGLDVDADGIEDLRREGHQDPAAKRNQHVVDNELAGEADEVHAPRHLAPAAARISDAHDEPERDRQVQRGKRLGVAVRRERIDIGEERGGNERCREPTGSLRVQPPFPHEIARQQRQDEEAEVARVESLMRVQGDSKKRRQLDRHGGGDREAESNDGLSKRVRVSPGA